MAAAVKREPDEDQCKSNCIRQRADGHHDFRAARFHTLIPPILFGSDDEVLPVFKYDREHTTEEELVDMWKKCDPELTDVSADPRNCAFQTDSTWCGQLALARAH